jgi:general secretion pathway protein E
MATVSPGAKVDRKLQMREVLDWLVEDGVIAPESADKLLQESRVGKGGNKHPIHFLSEARVRSLKAPQNVLTAEALAEWLAGRLRMQYFRIDPLKIDLRAVTQVMSAEYAQRRGILPV